jgi:16S rRNA processing protein RimM
MSADRRVSVGTIKDAFGLKGELYIAFRGGSHGEWLDDQEEPVMHLKDAHGRFHEFSVVSYREHKAGLVVRLEGVADRTQAEEMVGWTYWIDPGSFAAESGDQPYLAELLGCEVFREEGESLGLIESFLRAPQADLLVVRNAGGMVEVPFLEALVVEMDLAKKRLVMRLPAEFLDPDFWKAD